MEATARFSAAVISINRRAPASAASAAAGAQQRGANATALLRVAHHRGQLGQTGLRGEDPGPGRVTEQPAVTAGQPGAAGRATGQQGGDHRRLRTRADASQEPEVGRARRQAGQQLGEVAGVALVFRPHVQAVPGRGVLIPPVASGYGTVVDRHDRRPLSLRHGRSWLQFSRSVNKT